MLTLGLGNRSGVANRVGVARQCTGFTLIEIMVVLLLMGIVTALAVVNMAPDDKQVLHRQAELLAQLLEQAGQDARTRGQSVMWVSDGHHYAFQALQTAAGQAVGEQDGPVWDGDLYRPHDLPDGMVIESRAVQQVGYLPGAQIVFHASGINSPFELRVVKQVLMLHIVSDPMNRVTVRAVVPDQ